VIPPVRSLTVVPTGEVMRSTSVWVALFTVDGTLKPTVGIKTREDVDGREVEGISGCTTVACASSAEARTTSPVFSVFSAEESTSVSDDFFAR
jgi:hypothetical protein